MTPAPSTDELIARTHGVAGRFHVRMRRAMSAVPGNPRQVNVDRIGPVWVTRLRDAAAGCDEVIALADLASTSHRNMERAGLRTLVTMPQWTFAR